jgi:Leucine-rich repeat (LRR) protein
MIAKTLVQVLQSKNLKSILLRSSQDLICSNLFCEKLGEPCICRLERALSKDGLSTTVQELDLHGNNLKDLPPSLYKLSELRVLNLSNNKLSNLSIENLQRLKNLEKLDISGNPLSIEARAILEDAQRNHSIKAKISYEN